MTKSYSNNVVKIKKLIFADSSFVDCNLLEEFNSFLEDEVIDACRKLLTHLTLSPETHVDLCVLLVQLGEIHLGDAAKYLCLLTGNELMRAEQKHLIDVAWLVNADLKDGRLEIDEDTLLEDTIKAIDIP